MRRPRRFRAERRHKHCREERNEASCDQHAGTAGRQGASDGIPRYSDDSVESPKPRLRFHACGNSRCTKGQRKAQRTADRTSPRETSVAPKKNGRPPCAPCTRAARASTTQRQCATCKNPGSVHDIRTADSGGVVPCAQARCMSTNAGRQRYPYRLDRWHEHLAKEPSCECEVSRRLAWRKAHCLFAVAAGTA